MVKIEGSLDGHIETCQCDGCLAWREVGMMTDEEIRADLVEELGSEEAVDEHVAKMWGWVELLLRRRRGQKDH